MDLVDQIRHRFVDELVTPDGAAAADSTSGKLNPVQGVAGPRGSAENIGRAAIGADHIAAAFGGMGGLGDLTGQRLGHRFDDVHAATGSRIVATCTHGIQIGSWRASSTFQAISHKPGAKASAV